MIDALAAPRAVVGATAVAEEAGGGTAVGARATLAAVAALRVAGARLAAAALPGVAADTGAAGALGAHRAGTALGLHARAGAAADVVSPPADATLAVRGASRARRGAAHLAGSAIAGLAAVPLYAAAHATAAALPALLVLPAVAAPEKPAHLAQRAFLYGAGGPTVRPRRSRVPTLAGLEGGESEQRCCQPPRPPALWPPQGRSHVGASTATSPPRARSPRGSPGRTSS